MKEYSTFPTASELESHNRRQFSVITRTPSLFGVFLFFVGRSVTSLCKGYSQRILSSSNRANKLNKFRFLVLWGMCVKYYFSHFWIQQKFYNSYIWVATQPLRQCFVAYFELIKFRAQSCNLRSCLFRCDTRSYEWGSHWDSNPLAC